MRIRESTERRMEVEQPGSGWNHPKSEASEEREGRRVGNWQYEWLDPAGCRNYDRKDDSLKSSRENGQDAYREIGSICLAIDERCPMVREEEKEDRERKKENVRFWYGTVKMAEGGAKKESTASLPGGRRVWGIVAEEEEEGLVEGERGLAGFTLVRPTTLAVAY
ncbi:hypothetical protein M0804_010382 [Polistes exclamans]|nr:hypothetical protein M0804_010382 [Polistes exclamans]